jgi:hypothetical protein
MPRAGIVKSFHCSYLSEREKYLRARVQVGVDEHRHRRLMDADESAGDLARRVEKMVDPRVELLRRRLEGFVGHDHSVVLRSVLACHPPTVTW